MCKKEKRKKIDLSAIIEERNKPLRRLNIHIKIKWVVWAYWEKDWLIQ